MAKEKKNKNTHQTLKESIKFLLPCACFGVPGIIAATSYLATVTSMLNNQKYIAYLEAKNSLLAEMDKVNGQVLSDTMIRQTSDEVVQYMTPALKDSMLQLISDEISSYDPNTKLYTYYKWVDDYMAQRWSDKGITDVAGFMDYYAECYADRRTNPEPFNEIANFYVDFYNIMLTNSKPETTQAIEGIAQDIANNSSLDIVTALEDTKETGILLGILAVSGIIIGKKVYDKIKLHNCVQEVTKSDELTFALAKLIQAKSEVEDKVNMQEALSEQNIEAFDTTQNDEVMKK